MIIGSIRKLEVGKTYNQNAFDSKFYLYVNRVAHHEFTFYVLRESSYEEYMESLKDKYESLSGLNPSPPSYYYYDASFD